MGSYVVKILRVKENTSISLYTLNILGNIKSTNLTPVSHMCVCLWCDYASVFLGRIV